MTETTPTQNPKEYWNGFPEAPYSTTFRWIDAHGVNQMTTVRGWTGISMLECVAKMQDYILEHGGKFEADRPAAKPVKMNAAPAPTPAPAASAPDPKSGKPGDSFMIEVASLEWTPKPDGKVEVKIFGPGRKYPDLYWNTTVKQAIVGLQAADVHLTEEDLRFAKTMSVNMYAHYVLSEKLSASGKPYKNLVQLSADPFPVSE